jgi:hypothetical protein
VTALFIYLTILTKQSIESMQALGTNVNLGHQGNFEADQSLCPKNRMGETSVVVSVVVW